MQKMSLTKKACRTASLLLLKQCRYPINQAVNHTCRNPINDNRSSNLENFGTYPQDEAFCLCQVRTQCFLSKQVIIFRQMSFYPDANSRFRSNRAIGPGLRLSPSWDIKAPPDYPAICITDSRISVIKLSLACRSSSIRPPPYTRTYLTIRRTTSG